MIEQELASTLLILVEAKSRLLMPAISLLHNRVVAHLLVVVYFAHMIIIGPSDSHGAISGCRRMNAYHPRLGMLIVDRLLCFCQRIVST